MKHTKLPRALTGLLLAGLLVAACAEPDGNDSGAGGGATTVPTTLPGNPPATEPTPPAGEVTVTGTVIEGVEPNCLLLDRRRAHLPAGRGRPGRAAGRRPGGGDRPGRPGPAQHLPAGRAAGGGLDRGGPLARPTGRPQARYRSAPAGRRRSSSLPRGMARNHSTTASRALTKATGTDSANIATGDSDASIAHR